MLEVCCCPIRASALVSGSSIEFQVAANDAFDAVFPLRCWKDMHDTVGQHEEVSRSRSSNAKSRPNEEDSVLLPMIHCPTARSGQTSMFERLELMHVLRLPRMHWQSNPLPPAVTATTTWLNRLFFGCTGPTNPVASLISFLSVRAPSKLQSD
ncbi:hypothetical protein GJ744_011120 [Endocarpon pusillum]|uniref:Uncharacterized protein n=1 Tax=Endocarpon pusillum TaxID=364733 RepID=A0A8H7AF16_9EURO|nr:hypothetical protein GJ744_011120 [Endocarpon pusillum]